MKQVDVLVGITAVLLKKQSNCTTKPSRQLGLATLYVQIVNNEGDFEIIQVSFDKNQSKKKKFKGTWDVLARRVLFLSWLS